MTAAEIRASTFLPGGTITLPARCKPSKACSTDTTRSPVLMHARIVQREDELWLCATDAYIAVAVKLDDYGTAQEGIIPVGALRLIEKGMEAQQISPTAWRVLTDEGTLTFDTGALRSKFPDLATLGMWDDDNGESVELGTTLHVGLDPDFMRRVGLALGIPKHIGMRFTFTGGLRPVKIQALIGIGNVVDNDRRALQMPIQLNA